MTYVAGYRFGQDSVHGVNGVVSLLRKSTEETHELLVSRMLYGTNVYHVLEASAIELRRCNAAPDIASELEQYAAFVQKTRNSTDLGDLRLYEIVDDLLAFMNASIDALDAQLREDAAGIAH